MVTLKFTKLLFHQENNYDVRPQDAGKDIDVSDPGWNQDNNTPQIPKPGFEYIDSLKSKLVQGKPFTIFSDKQVTNYKGDLQFEKTENNVTTLLFKRPNGTFYKMDKSTYKMHQVIQLEKLI